MSTQARKPAGSTGSTGGQFCETPRGEADLMLDDPPPPRVEQSGQDYEIHGIGSGRAPLRYPNLDAQLRMDTEHGLEPTSITTLYQMTGPGESATAWVDLADGTDLIYLIEATHRNGRRTQHTILGAARPDVL